MRIRFRFVVRSHSYAPAEREAFVSIRGRLGIDEEAEHFWTTAGEQTETLENWMIFITYNSIGRGQGLCRGTTLHYCSSVLFSR